jgi:anti-sigma factor RsiW
MSTDIMSHDQAVSSQAAERYVLGELTPSERDAFEGHFFDCAVCFEQVELGAQFLGRAREVLDREPEPGWLAGMLGDLRRPAPVFVSAMLLCAIAIGVHQQSVISTARAPRVEERYVLTAAVKGEGAAKPISVSRRSGLSLGLEFQRQPQFASYQAEIIDAAGKSRFQLPLTESNRDIASIGLPANVLEAGTYSMVVQGVTKDGAKTEIRRGAFDLKFTD